MPLNLFYTMVQKSQKCSTKNSNQGGSCLKCIHHACYASTISHHTMAVPVAVVRAAPRMILAPVTLDTVEIAGLIAADDQRLFTPLAQVTPTTCKKAVFACLDTNVTSIYNSLRPVLWLRRDVEQASWRGQSRPRRRRYTESADWPHVRRYLKPTVTPSLPYYMSLVCKRSANLWYGP